MFGRLNVAPNRITHTKAYPGVIVQGTYPVYLCFRDLFLHVINNTEVQFGFLAAKPSKRVLPCGTGRMDDRPLGDFHEVCKCLIRNGCGIICVIWSVVKPAALGTCIEVTKEHAGVRGRAQCSC